VSESLLSPPKPLGESRAEARQEPLTKKRLEDITRVIARAFKSLGETMLSRQDLALAAGKGDLGLLGAGELRESLSTLEGQNKVFLSGDLVFLI